MRLFPIALLASILSVPAFAGDSCGFLHKQTQAFSDAGQRGDGVGMAKMLDPGVIFFNETGEKASRADMASAKHIDTWGRHPSWIGRSKSPKRPCRSRSSFRQAQYVCCGSMREAVA